MSSKLPHFLREKLGRLEGAALNDAALSAIRQYQQHQENLPYTMEIWASNQRALYSEIIDELQQTVSHYDNTKTRPS
jgi:hypothetical protein